jgi:hypothetical protein
VSHPCASSAARWLVTATPGGSRRRYLLHETIDAAEAKKARDAAQRWLADLFPEADWRVCLHVLTEVV